MSNSAGMLGPIQSVDAGVGFRTTDLRKEVDRAGRLTHTLAALASRVTSREPVFVWLFGRDDEVRMVVGAILSDWSDAVINAEVATCRMRAYLDEVEHSLDQRFRPRAGTVPSRNTVLRRRSAGGESAGRCAPDQSSTLPALSDEACEAATS